jgi:hypothetical protein
MKMARLARVARIATLPETRNVIFAAVRSTTLRTGLRRALHDPSGVVRELRPTTVQRAVMRSVRHPAVQELANAGLLLLPGRYIPLGWVATWAARHIRRRHLESTIAASGPAPYGVDHLGTWRQGARDTTNQPASISQEI